MDRHEVFIEARGAGLAGTLDVPQGACAIVLFAHGSGSSRSSPRNQQVARAIRQAGIGTLLFDLLTPEEEAKDRHTGHLRFDVELLASRLAQATEWIVAQGDARGRTIGYFGASTGGAAALIAAARLQDRIGAVVSRGGRPDLAGAHLDEVSAPTLLIVGERDPAVLALNRAAYTVLRCTRELAIVPRATHLFEEPGALEEVADLAVDWLRRHLVPEDRIDPGHGKRDRSHPAA